MKQTNQSWINIGTTCKVVFWRGTLRVQCRHDWDFTCSMINDSRTLRPADFEKSVCEIGEIVYEILRSRIYNTSLLEKMLSLLGFFLDLAFYHYFSRKPSLMSLRLYKFLFLRWKRKSLHFDGGFCWGGVCVPKVLHYDDDGNGAHTSFVLDIS